MFVPVKLERNVTKDKKEKWKEKIYMFKVNKLFLYVISNSFYLFLTLLYKN